MQKLLALKKEYEREGFHMQRLYKRRRADDAGIMRSTLGQIYEKPVFIVKPKQTTSSSCKQIVEEIIDAFEDHCDENAEEVKEYVTSALSWSELGGTQDGD